MRHVDATRTCAHQRGFTLIELMVGLVLGLLTLLVITQVLLFAEGKRRTLTMGSDAQVNGALALYAIQRDIQMAGYGAVASPDALGCPVKGQYDVGGSSVGFTLAPVVIGVGVDGAPDTVKVLQGQTPGVSVPMLLTENHLQGSAFFIVKSSFGVTAGDLMIAVPPLQSETNWCTLFNVTNDAGNILTAIGPTRVPIGIGIGIGGKWNQVAAVPAGGYAAGSYLLNMGSLISRTYAINDLYNLTLGELSPIDGTVQTQELYPQIVSLKAMYGKDTDADSAVDTYDTTTPATSADWQKVLSIRIAVVARSNQYEKNEVTATAPLWNVGDLGAASAVTGFTNCSDATTRCLPIKVSQVADWKHYRYKVYDTVVPLRNVLWNLGQTP